MSSSASVRAVSSRLGLTSRRVAEIGVGWSLYTLVSWLFDHVLYVYVVYRLGILVGGAVMTTLSLFACLAALVVYERMRIDWLGVGIIDGLLNDPNPSWYRRLISGAARYGAISTFIALCVYQDPFVTTAYFRRGRFDGLRLRDWRIFFASVVVSNGYWTVRSRAVAGIFVAVWQHARGVW